MINFFFKLLTDKYYESIFFPLGEHYVFIQLHCINIFLSVNIKFMKVYILYVLMSDGNIEYIYIRLYIGSIILTGLDLMKLLCSVEFPLE